MNICILGSTTSIIPPKGQAAIERLVYQQARLLAKQGHSILLFTLSGSTISEPNVRVIEVGSGEALLGSGNTNQIREQDLETYGVAYPIRKRLTHLATAMSELVSQQDKYDVILNNVQDESVLLPFVSLLKKPLYHILHLPIFPELATLFTSYKTPLISISQAQRKSFPELNYVANIPNAVDTDEFSFSDKDQGYLLYLGSIGKNKNPHEAILAAKKAKVPIKIGGRIKDQDYYQKEILPHVDGEQVQWIGECTPEEVIALYQGAKAFLFPTKWEEPFGLVMIEAMSCGTPVIAYPNGAVPEVVSDGKTGFLVENVDQMAEKIGIIDQISRKDCRTYVVDNFSLDNMIEAYEALLTGGKVQ